jgi:hypothetical protein
MMLCNVTINTLWEHIQVYINSDACAVANV